MNHAELPFTTGNEDTRKTRAVIDQLKASMQTTTDPAVRAEIQDEMGCVAMSWQVRQILIDDAD